MEGNAEGFKSFGFKQNRQLFSKQRAVGGYFQRRFALHTIRNFNNFLKLGVEQGLAHDVKKNIIRLSVYFTDDLLKFGGAHEARRALVSGAKGAAEVTDVGYFNIDVFHQYVGLSRRHSPSCRTKVRRAFVLSSPSMASTVTLTIFAFEGLVISMVERSYLRSPFT